MTLHLKSRGYPFRPRLLFSSFIVVGVGFPNCVLFQERTLLNLSSELSFHSSELLFRPSVGKFRFPPSYWEIPRERLKSAEM